MKNKFEEWMKDVEKKLPSTAYNYARSIDKISKHYSENTGRYLDIYNETDLDLLKNIAKEYGLEGKYSDFGNYGNGTVRNAIATYIRFLESIETEQKLETFSQENLTLDIQKLVYILNNDEVKKNNWTKYIIEFHKSWLKHGDNISLKADGKYIWGKRILIDLNKIIGEVFDEYKDKNIVEFFNGKNKIFIKEIEEEDLLQIAFQNNLKFMDFKRIINKLFTKDEVQDIETTKGEINKDEIVDLAYKSINNIKNELNVFKDIIDYCGCEITQLNQDIILRDEKLARQEYTISSLMTQLESAKEPLEELISIKENLEGIKVLLEEDNLF